MTKRLLNSLGAMVRAKRDRKTLREAAKEVGIGPATLMRVENGRVPDVTTFGKICKWLEVDPGSFLDFRRPDSSSGAAESDDMVQPIQISAHLRVDQTPKPETIEALSKMILIALQKQEKPETTAIIDDDV